MPQPSTISVNDRSSTPVAFDFVPNGRTATGVMSFVNTNGVKVSDKTITLSLRQSGSKYKIRMVTSVPTVQTETINGIDSPKVVRSAYADTTFTFDEESTHQERMDLVGFHAGAMGADQTMVDSVVTALEGWHS